MIEEGDNIQEDDKEVDCLENDYSCDNDTTEQGDDTEEDDNTEKDGYTGRVDSREDMTPQRRMITREEGGNTEEESNEAEDNEEETDNFTIRNKGDCSNREAEEDEEGGMAKTEEEEEDGMKQREDSGECCDTCSRHVGEDNKPNKGNGKERCNCLKDRKEDNAKRNETDKGHHDT